MKQNVFSTPSPPPLPKSPLQSTNHALQARPDRRQDDIESAPPGKLCGMLLESIEKRKRRLKKNPKGRFALGGKRITDFQRTAFPLYRRAQESKGTSQRGRVKGDESKGTSQRGRVKGDESKGTDKLFVL
ncbi:MAG: hypothetical protein SGI71_01970 [Verrucomicrobiota bacterium]|nr:hypothetical protein [Verrucomicrobiota bacterium]